jgi:hypothetical protein
MPVSCILVMAMIIFLGSNKGSMDIYLTANTETILSMVLPLKSKSHLRKQIGNGYSLKE